MLSHAKVSTPLTPCSCVHLIHCLAAVIVPRIASYLQVLPLQLSIRGFLQNSLTTLRSALEETHKNKTKEKQNNLKVERCRAAGGSAHQNRFNPVLLASTWSKKVSCVQVQRNQTCFSLFLKRWGIQVCTRYESDTQPVMAEATFPWVSSTSVLLAC